MKPSPPTVAVTVVSRTTSVTASETRTPMNSRSLQPRISRFDAEGRLIEEFLQTDNRGMLRQLGAADA